MSSSLPCNFGKFSTGAKHSRMFLVLAMEYALIQCTLFKCSGKMEIGTKKLYQEEENREEEWKTRDYMV